MERFLKKLWEKLKKYLKPFLSLKFLLCFGIAWTITNGWAYVFIALGSVFDIKWMFTIGTSYLAFLWLPFTPEKIITIPLAILFQKWFFKKDEKLKAQLEEMHLEAKKDFQKIKDKFRRKNK